MTFGVSVTVIRPHLPPQPREPETAMSGKSQCDGVRLRGANEELVSQRLCRW